MFAFGVKLRSRSAGDGFVDFAGVYKSRCSIGPSSAARWMAICWRIAQRGTICVFESKPRNSEGRQFMVRHASKLLRAALELIFCVPTTSSKCGIVPSGR